MLLLLSKGDFGDSTKGGRAKERGVNWASTSIGKKPTFTRGGGKLTQKNGGEKGEGSSGKRRVLPEGVDGSKVQVLKKGAQSKSVRKERSCAEKKDKRTGPMN